MSAGFLFDPMGGVTFPIRYSQEIADVVAWHAWNLQHIVWQGEPYRLEHRGELFEDRHWRDYQRRLHVFYDTGVFPKAGPV